MQNNFLEDYFEGLNENKDGKKDEMVRIEEDMNSSEVHTFHEIKSHAIDVTILDIMLMNVQTNTKIKEITHHTRNHLHQRFQTKKIQAAATQVMILPSSLEKTPDNI
ncbi:hypothetical protein Tco_0744526 [Tanacetum coccineum]